ncbi:hypothetical protein FACS189442_1160 [Spirochaetia bacterium]|nr:hypothetical protein FACS189442_1160 [Spirochaetia bacterium]
MLSPHEYESEMIYSGNRYIIWKTGDTVISAETLNYITGKLDELVMPRVTAIWGEWADVDQNNKITLLFSRSINTENKATGFFNSDDLYSRDIDTASGAYNPYSNEADIIYLAAPEEGSDSSYSKETILATIAHELTHVINYTQKTYRNNEFIEEVFLDEGWSHLSENLCGLGISGGNIYFLEEYFRNTANFSFCTANKSGQYDSAGMRGAMTLFLSYLFWKSGGMEIDNAGMGGVIDTGGIAFLKKMVGLEETGWTSIGTAYGNSIDDLFLEFSHDLNKNRINPEDFNYKTDPYTGEAIEFFSKMRIASDGTDRMVNPQIINTKITTLLPWSICYFEPLVLADSSRIKVKSESVSGSVFFNLLKGN